MQLYERAVNRLGNKNCKIFFLVVILLTLGWTFQSTGQPRVADKPAKLDSILSAHIARNSFWSVTVRDTNGKFLLRHNSDKLIHPASNLKLLTSAAVLDELGKSFRYETPIYGIGNLEKNVWRGDLLIIGSGDPSIDGNFYNRDRWHVFHKFYAFLDSLNITRINGSIIGNDAYFTQIPYPEGWDWDDLSFYYAVEIGALSFNGNTVDLTVHAEGELGETPRITWFPYDTDYVKFINEQVITPEYTEYDEYYRRILGTNTIVLGSKLPRGYVERESLSITNPARFFIDSFKKYLSQNGIAVDGSLVVDHQPPSSDTSDYRLFGIHRSRPVDTLLHQINKESSNFYTEMMLRTASAQHYDTQGSTELGIRLVKKFAHEMRVDTSKLRITDGSGMSGSTLFTTKGITTLLLNMRNHKHFDAFRESLSRAGSSGTLKDRFVMSPVNGNLRGKSGFISGVRTLSGYLQTETGNEVIISIAANNFTKQKRIIDEVQEEIVERLFRNY